ncbi:MAG TPA: hypothetical protein VMZ92_18310 [Planctomycetota bacterium]|nr:hypothetical protein [Planctomycetota bacterium]
MSENTPEAPHGAGEVITFIIGVALPVLSAGILINEVLRETVGAYIPMDAVLSAATTRLLGASSVLLGFAMCLPLSFERGADPHSRPLYRVFLVVNLALGVGWAVLLTR